MMQIVQIDKDFPQVIVYGKEIFFTQQEFKLFVFLWENRNRTCSRSIILDRIWLYNQAAETRVVDVYVGYIRRKLRGTPLFAKLVSVRSWGYRFIWEEDSKIIYSCSCDCSTCKLCLRKPQNAILDELHWKKDKDQRTYE